jgi:hypothetical protein
MFVELLIQHLEPGQIANAILVATASITLRYALRFLLPAILSFLANLLVLLVLFALFIAGICFLALFAPMP